MIAMRGAGRWRGGGGRFQLAGRQETLRRLQRSAAAAGDCTQRSQSAPGCNTHRHSPENTLTDAEPGFVSPITAAITVHRSRVSTIREIAPRRNEAKFIFIAGVLRLVCWGAA